MKESLLKGSDEWELRKLAKNIREVGVHLHRYQMGQWTHVSSNRSATLCGTPRCFKLKIKNMEAE